MKTVIVSGAAGELAQFVIAEFHSRGWMVHGLVRRSGSSKVTDTTRYQEWSCDVGNFSELTEVLSSISVSHAFVHLVGGIKAGSSIVDTDVELLQSMLRLNTQSTFVALKCSLPLLRQQRGSFVAVGSQSVFQPSAGKAAYSASKAAVVSLCATAAEEERFNGVRVNVVVPGILNTATNRTWAEGNEADHWTDPHECAQLIADLCGDTTRALTGAVLPVYGH